MTWPFIWTNLNPLYPRMLCAPVVLEKKIFKYLQYNFTYSLLSPSEKGVALHLCKLESPPSKDALWQVRLKLAQWFWRRSWKCEKLTDRQTDRQTTDNRRSEKLTWAFSSGELKAMHSLKHTCIYCFSFGVKCLSAMFHTYTFLFQKELIKDEDFIKEALDRQEIDSGEEDLLSFIDYKWQPIKQMNLSK